MKSRARRIIVALVTVLAALGVGIVFAALIVLKSSLPQLEGRISLAGLQQEIEITFDAMGIPQVWAQTDADAYFAMGYLHAADRMFQMELHRRVAAGRLSEMLGAQTLDFDIWQRRVGHTRKAREAVRGLSDRNRHLLQAYCNGVNAYRGSCTSLPFEFYLLPTDFDTWTVEDCLTVLSFQTWFSDALMSRDRFYLNLIEQVGIDSAQQFFQEYPAWAPTTVPSDVHSQGTEPDSSVTWSWLTSAWQRKVSRWLLADEQPPFLSTRASNAWAVAPEKSASGAAMLCSDPHLELTRLPQFWYMLGVHVADGNRGALGITTPGVPAVIMGHNGRAAWGMTAAGVDVVDYHIETLNSEDSNQYLAPGGWQPFELIVDSIMVAGWDSVRHLTIRISINGPVVREADSADRVYTLQWAGFDADLDAALSAAHDLPAVDNFDDFRKIVTLLGALNGNWIYADAGGTIGYQLGAPVPVRPQERGGQLPIPGWTDDFDWGGYLPLEKTPHALNPAQGWLASCNNYPGGDTHIPGTYFPERIMRISGLLASRDTLTVEDMKRFQGDMISTYLLRWKDEVAALLDSLGETGQAHAVRNWDGSTGLDSRVVPLIKIFLSRLKQLTFSDELGKAADGVSRLVMEELYWSGQGDWFDDKSTADSIETRADIARRALREAVEIVGDRTWGDLNQLSMRHPLAGVPILGSLLNLERGPWPWPGTGSTLNAALGEEHADGRFDVLVGPSWRFIIDFASIDSALFVLPAGNSGNPMSSHFDDFLDLWRQHRYWTVPFSRERVSQQAVSTLTLVPTAAE